MEVKQTAVLHHLRHVFVLFALDDPQRGDLTRRYPYPTDISQEKDKQRDSLVDPIHVLLLSVAPQLGLRCEHFWCQE